MYRKTMALVSAVALLLATGIFLTGAVPAVQAEEAKKATPAKPLVVAPGEDIGTFEYKTAEGQPFTEKDIKGKKTALIFFQTACSICAGEIKAVRDIQTRVKDVNIVLFSVDMRAPADSYATYRKNYAGDLPIVMDSSFSLPRRFSVSSTPAIAFIDSKGLLTKVKVGYNTRQKEELESAIKALK
jgi:cytochrome oxidase Cu insertion factor (SCO1/SenC/PrrC family)